MNEDQNIEQSPQDAKTESPKQMNDESQAVNHETSNVNEEAKPLTINNEPLTNMEVHHHPNLHHRKKHWKEYFLEFLMLFLAVFLGFVAENLREKSADRNKEKEYMHSMVNDLQKDIAIMNIQIHALNYQVNGHDTLEYMLENPLNNSEYYRKLYYMNTAFTWDDIDVTFAEGTFSELKSSGNLRLIESKAIMDSILQYQSIIAYCELQHNWCKESISKTYFFATDIFDISCYAKYNNFLNSVDYENRIYIPYEKVKQLISEKPKLLTNDATILKKYSRLVNNEKTQMALYLFYVEVSKKMAIRLMQQIENEYHFQ